VGLFETCRMLFLAQNIFLGTYAYIISLIWRSVLKQHFATFASHENHTAWGHEMRSPPRPKSYAGEKEMCERNGNRTENMIAGSFCYCVQNCLVIRNINNMTYCGSKRWNQLQCGKIVLCFFSDMKYSCKEISNAGFVEKVITFMKQRLGIC
jgi:hypothetical protein